MPSPRSPKKTKRAPAVSLDEGRQVSAPLSSEIDSRTPGSFQITPEKLPLPSYNSRPSLGNPSEFDVNPALSGLNHQRLLSPTGVANLSKPVATTPTSKRVVGGLGCNCRNTACLKLYCMCFSDCRPCGLSCKCSDGCKNQNTVGHEGEPILNGGALEARFKMKDAQVHNIPSNEKDPAKIAQYVQLLRTSSSCTCKKNKCLRKYCECFSKGVSCGDLCTCADCQNPINTGNVHSKQPPHCSAAERREYEKNQRRPVAGKKPDLTPIAIKSEKPKRKRKHPATISPVGRTSSLLDKDEQALADLASQLSRRVSPRVAKLGPVDYNEVGEQEYLHDPTNSSLLLGLPELLESAATEQDTQVQGAKRKPAKFAVRRKPAPTFTVKGAMRNARPSKAERKAKLKTLATKLKVQMQQVDAGVFAPKRTSDEDFNEVYYTQGDGERLVDIAKKFNQDVATLLALNVKRINRLKIKSKLRRGTSVVIQENVRDAGAAVDEDSASIYSSGSDTSMDTIDSNLDDIGFGAVRVRVPSAAAVAAAAAAGAAPAMQTMTTMTTMPGSDLDVLMPVPEDSFEFVFDGHEQVFPLDQQSATGTLPGTLQPLPVTAHEHEQDAMQMGFGWQNKVDSLWSCDGMPFEQYEHLLLTRQNLPAEQTDIP